MKQGLVLMDVRIWFSGKCFPGLTFFDVIMADKLQFVFDLVL